MFIYLCLQEELWTGSQVSDSAFLAGKERSLRPLGPPGGHDGHYSAQRGQCPGVSLPNSAPFCDRKDTVADWCWLDGDFGVFWISSSCLFLQVSFAIMLFIVKKTHNKICHFHNIFTVFTRTVYINIEYIPMIVNQSFRTFHLVELKLCIR